jgi:hypothetical protein
MYDRVIVRDAANNPLWRVVVGKGERVIYVAAAEALDAIAAGRVSAVGFPQSDVFIDDSTHEGGGVEWDRLTPYPV